MFLRTLPRLGKRLCRNVAGVQWEWWFHRGGCGEWFKANRNTLTNEVHETVLPRDEEQRG